MVIRDEMKFWRVFFFKELIPFDLAKYMTHSIFQAGGSKSPSRMFTRYMR